MEQAQHDTGSVEDLHPEVPQESEVIIGVLSRDRITEAWGSIRDRVAQALEYGRGETSEEAILMGLLNGTNHAIVVSDNEAVQGVFILGTVAYPGGEALRVTHGACNLPSRLWLDRLVALLDQGALNMGARWIEVNGRRGFEKLLEPYSHHVYTVSVREVPHEREQSDH